MLIILLTIDQFPKHLDKICAGARRRHSKVSVAPSILGKHPKFTSNGGVIGGYFAYLTLIDTWSNAHLFTSRTSELRTYRLCSTRQCTAKRLLCDSPISDLYILSLSNCPARVRYMTYLDTQALSTMLVKSNATIGWPRKCAPAFLFISAIIATVVVQQSYLFAVQADSNVYLICLGKPLSNVIGKKVLVIQPNCHDLQHESLNLAVSVYINNVSLHIWLTSYNDGFLVTYLRLTALPKTADLHNTGHLVSWTRYIQIERRWNKYCV